MITLKSTRRTTAIFARTRPNSNRWFSKVFKLNACLAKVSAVRLVLLLHEFTFRFTPHAYQANTWVASCTQSTCELAANLHPPVGWQGACCQCLWAEGTGAQSTYSQQLLRSKTATEIEFALPGTAVSCVCMQRGGMQFKVARHDCTLLARPHGHASIDL